jgi:hypothetical protein
LCLLVDTSRSQIEVLDRERSAGYEFLTHLLCEKIDQAFEEGPGFPQDRTHHEDAGSGNPNP